jgi:hypothetical protein
VLRGCPAFISAQAVDYSHYERFPEINRTMMPVNPDLSLEKVAEAVRLQILRWGQQGGNMKVLLYHKKISREQEKLFSLYVQN